MDTVTHMLFGLTIYGSINKQETEKNTRNALFFTSVVGSLLPDVDVISRLWDTEGMYQMWHRGITHSLFLVPIWALLLWLVCRLLWKTKDRRIFYIGLLSVFIHTTSDLFNAWGTGYLEPFSSIRITFGTIPIVDVVFWFIMGGCYLFVRLQRKRSSKRGQGVASHSVYRFAWLLMCLHVLIQSAQGFVIYQSVASDYEQHTLSASFVPWHFTVIGKEQGQVELSQATLWNGTSVIETLQTKEDADLEELFEQNPKAKTLYEWAPFVVIVDEEDVIGVYDPRFYRDGQSFLFEYIERVTE